MESQDLNIQKIVEEYAESVVQSIAIAQRMGMLENEDDLKQLISAGMECAVEDAILRLTQISSNLD